MLVRAFIARKDTLTPTLIGMCALAVTVIVSLLFMGEIANPGGAIVSLLARLQGLIYAAFPGTGASATLAWRPPHRRLPLSRSAL